MYWTFSYSPVYENGKIEGVLVTCAETTGKVQTILRLIESETQLVFAIEATELGTWDYDPTSGKFRANNRLKNWFGLPLEEEIDLSLAISIIAEKDRMRVEQAIQTALDYNSGGLYDVEYTIIHPQTQQQRIIRAKGKAWFNEEKVTYRFNGTLQDVTQEVLARRKTEESDLFARSIIENSPVAQVVFIGEAMTITIINERMLEMMGRDACIIGMSFYDALPELEAPLKERLKHVYETGTTYYQPEEKLQLIRFNKPYTGYYNYTYQAIPDSTGKIYGIMVTAWEITEQVAIRHKIEEEKERTNIAIAAGELGVFEVDLATNTLLADERFNEIYGFEKTMPREEYIKLCHTDDLELRAQSLEIGIKTGVFGYEARFIKRDHVLCWIKCKGYVLYDQERKPLKLCGVIQDITEQKTFSESLSREVEERTLELHRSNDDLMQFAHVASHDLKEPVRKIKTFTGRLLNEHADAIPEKATIYLDKIRNATERMFSMIDGVLNYSTLNASEQINEPVDLNNVIENIQTDLEVVIQQLSAVIKKGELPVIEGSAVLIHQLFYNLINNSLKFSKTDVPPIITIVSSIIQLNDEPHAEIIISDNGIGFDSNNTASIFNAFTRLNSKDVYEGTGLGLALCKKIVERHHGIIAAKGIQQEGASFIISLPLKQLKKQLL